MKNNKFVKELNKVPYFANKFTVYGAHNEWYDELGNRFSIELNGTRISFFRFDPMMFIAGDEIMYDLFREDLVFKVKGSTSGILHVGDLND